MKKKEVIYYEQVLNDIAKRVHPRLIVYIDTIDIVDDDLSIVTIHVSFKNTSRVYSVKFEEEDIYDELDLEIMLNEAFQSLITKEEIKWVYIQV